MRTGQNKDLSTKEERIGIVKEIYEMERITSSMNYRIIYKKKTQNKFFHTYIGQYLSRKPNIVRVHSELRKCKDEMT